MSCGPTWAAPAGDPSPVTAIFSDEDLPGEWKQFAAVNAEWFSEAVTGLVSPGGAAQVGPQAKDHPVVAEWPAVA